MTVETVETEIVVVGAGIAGIATAYYLATRHRRRDLLLLDAGQPMGLTSAQSGDNYRDWWPHPVMAGFMGRSIELLETIARETSNAIHLTRRGYALATRDGAPEDLAGRLLAAYGAAPAGTVRLRKGRDGGDPRAYAPAGPGPWQAAPDGADVIADKALIERCFPQFDPAVTAVVHIRRAGDLSGQQLGQLMLERIKGSGGRFRGGRVRAVERAGERAGRFRLGVERDDGSYEVRADALVNAAGPFLGEVAGMLGCALPVETILQQKIAFEDRADAIPRYAPFAVDLDPQVLDWTEEERRLLADDGETAWLTERLPGGVHCRPDGGPHGKWIKLGWAYNTRSEPPDREPALDPQFPEIVLRGAARLHPALKAYYGRLPGRPAHYGGYYTMTRENWPLIGPLSRDGNLDGAFLVGALSGFGTMAACAAGELSAAWIAGAALPDYAQSLSLSRYADRDLMAELEALESKGLL